MQGQIFILNLLLQVISRRHEDPLLLSLAEIHDEDDLSAVEKIQAQVNVSMFDILFLFFVCIIVLVVWLLNSFILILCVIF